ncbi:hypothetical protein BDF19DRAFT_431709 [Syncephalis fuscata]|nr:hypothetical protein BDF19DRAFT_431709 [Syncephalis fuscata]
MNEPSSTTVCRLYTLLSLYQLLFSFSLPLYYLDDFTNQYFFLVCSQWCLNCIVFVFSLLRCLFCSSTVTSVSVCN